MKVALVIIAMITAGCGQIAGFVTAPQPCLARFTADRCGAMAERAAGDLGIDPDAVAALDVLPDPEADTTRLGGPPVFLRVHLADGTAMDTVIRCPGISSMYVPACMDDPAIRVSSVTISGYRDVPCFDDAGARCATPHPDIDPAAAAEATAVHVARFDISIDRVGRWEVPLGEGSLPNGILTEASFQLVEDWPDGVSLADAVAMLDVRSLEPNGKPFDNYYLHGWRDGVERFEAFLVFDVERFEPGAVLSVADVVVR